jgi:hypothetical protein
MNPDGEIDIPSEQPTMRIFQARKPYPNSTYFGMGWIQKPPPQPL